MSTESDHDDDTSGPLSLQDQCFIYILAHLKDYPVELLALLPKAWRTKLLRAAPALQLHKLESTTVSEGIDTDVFWQEMSRLKDSVWVNYIITESERSHDLNSGSQVPLKARFINYICHMLLNETNRRYAITRITEFLLAVHKDRLDSDVVCKMTTTHVSTQLMFSPPYYFIPFRCPRYTEQQIASLMISAGALPTALEIRAEQMTRTTLWISPALGYKPIGNLFGNLRFLLFNCTQLYCRPLNFIMTSFYRHATPNPTSPIQNCSLESLEFHAVCRESISCIAQHFSTAKGFKNLKRLQIQLVETAAPLGSELACIINNQMLTLECLHLSCLVPSQCTSIIHIYELFLSLANFVSRPQFRRLILDSFRNIPQILVEKLLLSFFATEPERKLTLCIKNSTIKKSDTVPLRIKNKDKDSSDKSTLATSIACTAYKNISFETVTVPVEFFTWFERVGSIYLHSLEFSNITVVPEVPSRHIIVTHSNERYVSDTRRVNHTRCVEQNKGPKAKLPETIDPRLVFYTHPGFRCIKFSWSQAEE